MLKLSYHLVCGVLLKKKKRFAKLKLSVKRWVRASCFICRGRQSVTDICRCSWKTRCYIKQLRRLKGLHRDSNAFFFFSIVILYVQFLPIKLIAAKGVMCRCVDRCAGGHVGSQFLSQIHSTTSCQVKIYNL